MSTPHTSPTLLIRAVRLAADLTERGAALESVPSVDLRISNGLIVEREIGRAHV